MLLMLAAVGLLAASFTLAWYEHDFSSGRQTPPGGYHDPADTREVRRHLEYAPLATSGDGVPADAAAAKQVVEWMGYALGAAIALLFVAAMAELRFLPRFLPRGASLLAQTLALMAVGSALWLAWNDLPLAVEGTADPFVAYLADAGYTRTTLGFGWAVAAFTVPLTLGSLLLKFQTGVDPMQILRKEAQ
jgi:hypothetical protein